MSKQTANHWNSVFSTRPQNAVSWYAPNLETSSHSIKRFARKWPAIIDVVGGESTLAHDLLAEGYRYITVLDISAKAIEVAKKRLAPFAVYIDWRVGDVTKADLPRNYYDVWHDRAVFH